jgi:hypothetical protein
MSRPEAWPDEFAGESAHGHASPPTSSGARNYTAKPSHWPRRRICGHPRPSVTVVSAPCMRRLAGGSRLGRSIDTASAVLRTLRCRIETRAVVVVVLADREQPLEES